MSETTELADLIIPDVTYLERHDPESMPSGLYPCLSIRQPVVQPLGGTQEFRKSLIDIIQKVDPDGSLGIKKYFAFSTPEEWMRAHFDNIPGLKEEGGYDHVDPNRFAQSLEAFIDGLWLNILLYPKTFSRQKARDECFAYLAAFFPKHFASFAEPGVCQSS